MAKCHKDQNAIALVLLAALPRVEDSSQQVL